MVRRTAILCGPLSGRLDTAYFTRLWPLFHLSCILYFRMEKTAKSKAARDYGGVCRRLGCRRSWNLRLRKPASLKKLLSPSQIAAITQGLRLLCIHGDNQKGRFFRCNQVLTHPFTAPVSQVQWFITTSTISGR